MEGECVDMLGGYDLLCVYMEGECIYKLGGHDVFVHIWYGVCMYTYMFEYVNESPQSGQSHHQNQSIELTGS